MDLGGPKILVVGYPKAGKTGALACLLEHYRLRVVSLDGNVRPLLTYAKPEARKNLEVVMLHDRLRIMANQQSPTVVGGPNTLKHLDELLDVGEFTDKRTEKVVKWGPLNEWDEDIILVVDPLTALARTVMRRQLTLSGRERQGPLYRDWLLAQNILDAWIEEKTSTDIKCGVMILAHLVMIEPKEAAEKDEEATKKARSQAAEVVPARLFPKTLGRALSPTIAQHFDATVLVEADGVTKRRYLITAPQPHVDVGVPAVNLKDRLPIGDGMLTIYEALRKGPNA